MGRIVVGAVSEWLAHPKRRHLRESMIEAAHRLLPGALATFSKLQADAMWAHKLFRRMKNSVSEAQRIIIAPPPSVVSSVAAVGSSGDDEDEDIADCGAVRAVVAELLNDAEDSDANLHGCTAALNVLTAGGCWSLQGMDVVLGNPATAEFVKVFVQRVYGIRSFNKTTSKAFEQLRDVGSKFVARMTAAGAVSVHQYTFDDAEEYARFANQCVLLQNKYTLQAEFATELYVLASPTNDIILRPLCCTMSGMMRRAFLLYPSCGTIATDVANIGYSHLIVILAAVLAELIEFIEDATLGARHSVLQLSVSFFIQPFGFSGVFVQFYHRGRLRVVCNKRAKKKTEIDV